MDGWTNFLLLKQEQLITQTSHIVFIWNRGDIALKLKLFLIGRNLIRKLKRFVDLIKS